MSCRLSRLFSKFSNHISPKTASNIKRFDPCDIRKILQIGTHNWIMMSENFVQRTETLPDKVCPSAENIYFNIRLGVVGYLNVCNYMPAHSSAIYRKLPNSRIPVP